MSTKLYSKEKYADTTSLASLKDDLLIKDQQNFCPVYNQVQSNITTIGPKSILCGIKA